MIQGSVGVEVERGVKDGIRARRMVNKVCLSLLCPVALRGASEHTPTPLTGREGLLDADRAFTHVSFKLRKVPNTHPPPAPHHEPIDKTGRISIFCTSRNAKKPDM